MKGINKLIILLLGTSMIACAPQGFDSQPPIASSPNQEGQDQLGGGGNAKSPSPDEMGVIESMKSSDQSYNSQVYIDKLNWMLVIRIPLGFNPFIDVTQLSLPKIKGGEVTTEIDSNLNAFVVVKLPLKNVLRGVTQLETATKLPNGDPLPKMPSGEPASLGLTISAKKNVKMNIYIAIEAVGVFVETPFDYPFPGYLSLPLKNEAQTQILGWFTLVPRKNEFNSGFFLSFKLPLEVSEILNKYL
ncbi:MAG TPA: hypothetical protein PLJ21_10160 [Pseudobdellovibrionaceae bacterium]|mgnify:CR=1 FL=1|nr:hypothetical protein [Pseudobdellovibrionaceae bacterium]